MSPPVFHIVAKDKEKEHITDEMQPGTMQKHGREKSKIYGYTYERLNIPRSCYLIRNASILAYKNIRKFPKGELIYKESNIYKDEEVCYEGKSL